MTDPSKIVKNPLFNASVTGVTVEDFSQNAVLLPAKEKPPAPTVSVSYDNLVKNNSAFLEPVTELNLLKSPTATNTLSFAQEETPVPQILTDPNVAYSTLQDPSGSKFSSSVFSSFSNILKTGFTSSSPQTSEPEPVPPPAGIDAFITGNSDNENIQVPLFIPQTATVNPEVPKPTVPQGPVNSYRRSSGLKRPTYAQVPGLTTTATQPPSIAPFTNPVPGDQPPLPPLPLSHQQDQNSFLTNYFQPIQPSVSPASSVASTTSNQESNIYLPSNHFKPISPLPPINNQHQATQLAYPQPAISSVAFQPIEEPLGFIRSSNNSGPVMDSISASEVLQSGIGTAPSTYNHATVNGSFIANTAKTNQTYRPVYHHWFYKKEIEGKTIWQPFSMNDSLSLEHAFTSNDLDPENVIATEGGRYDVNILRRQRVPVYWEGKTSEVRRCSWFYKGSADSRYTPYEENVATKLEEEYKTAFESNQWHKTIELTDGETVVFHGPDVLVLFPRAQSPDAWGNTPNQTRPRIVKRGLDDFNIDEGEPSKVDHLLFMVHGIGSVCDLKFRTVEEVVDDFRAIALQLVESHYRSSCEKGVVNRVEILPISWHKKLHSEETGIDQQLKNITLESIPKLRDFTNDTILDVLFYTSPVYSQTIISTVGTELNRIYELFQQRNPTFNGGVSLGGHSLGSLILFDLLSHQQADPENSLHTDEDPLANVNGAKPNPEERKINRRISYTMGSVGTGQPQIHYPHLNFQPTAFFAFGSPIGMFVTVRGLETLGEHFSLPTCPAFFNIFHPYDPVAYRLEALINPELAKLKPVLIPHHKGRKRMHLELKETMARVGADLKQKVYDSMKSTWNSFYQLAMFHKQDQPSLEEVNKAFQSQLETTSEVDEQEIQEEQTDIPLGTLNKGRRIDYVLQEAPFEIFNEYIFALTSHVCYWDSEDTMLLMLKEIYSTMGITTDSKIPQQTMTIERPPPSPKSIRESTGNQEHLGGIDPTYPIQVKSNLAPPPKAGFVRKT